MHVKYIGIVIYSDLVHGTQFVLHFNCSLEGITEE